MRHLMLRLLLVAVVVGFAEYGAGATEPQVAQSSMNAMTVSQLEKAGDAARFQKDYELAIQYFATALRKDPRNALLYNKMEMAKLKNNDSTGAREAFQKAVKINSKYTDAPNKLGAVDYMQSNFKSAAKQFKRA